MINADSGVNSSPNENRLFSAVSPHVHAKCTDDHPRVKHCSRSATASAAPAATRSRAQAGASSVLQHCRSHARLRADGVCRDAKNPASEAFGRLSGADTIYRPICEPVRSIRTRGQSNLCPRFRRTASRTSGSVISPIGFAGCLTAPSFFVLHSARKRRTINLLWALA